MPTWQTGGCKFNARYQKKKEASGNSQNQWRCAGIKDQKMDEFQKRTVPNAAKTQNEDKKLYANLAIRAICSSF